MVLEKMIKMFKKLFTNGKKDMKQIIIMKRKAQFESSAQRGKNGQDMLDHTIFVKLVALWGWLRGRGDRSG